MYHSDSLGVQTGMHLSDPTSCRVFVIFVEMHRLTQVLNYCNPNSECFLHFFPFMQIVSFSKFGSGIHPSSTSLRRCAKVLESSRNTTTSLASTKIDEAIDSGSCWAPIWFMWTSFIMLKICFKKRPETYISTSPGPLKHVQNRQVPAAAKSEDPFASRSKSKPPVKWLMW